MKRISKKILICLLTVATTTAAISWPIASSVLVTNHHNYGFIFEDQKFDSKDEIYHYVKNKSQKINTTQETNDSWWIIDDGKNKVYFADPESLRKYVYNYINTYVVNSAYDIRNYLNAQDGSVGTTANSKVIWKHLNWDLNNKNEIQIFRGKDGYAYLSEKEAKDSYLCLSDGYYFNQIFFPNKEILRKYLYDNDNYNFQANAITIKAPNTQISAPFLKNDPNFDSNIDLFIKNNYERYLEYNGSNGKKIFLNKANYKIEKDNIASDDIDYVAIESNQGKQNYIIDLDKSDNYELYGPYFYEGSFDVGNFSDKNSWKKIVINENSNNYSITQNEVDYIIGNFFSLVLGDQAFVTNDDHNTNQITTFFNIPFLKIFDHDLNKEVSADEYYANQIKAFNVELYNKIINKIETLSKGKKFNAFYKIPILYNSLIQNLVSYKAPTQLFQQTTKYFELITNYLQTIIDLIIPNESFLQAKNNHQHKFNAKEFFQIGNKKYDSNTNLASFMNEIKKYNFLVLAMVTYTYAINNINISNSVLPLNKQFFKKIITTEIITKAEFEKNFSLLEEIYNLYSSQNFQSFSKNVNDSLHFANLKKVIGNEDSQQIKILKSILIRNNLLRSMKNSILEENLNDFNVFMQKLKQQALLSENKNKFNFSKVETVYNYLSSFSQVQFSKTQIFYLAWFMQFSNVEFHNNQKKAFTDFINNYLSNNNLFQDIVSGGMWLTRALIDLFLPEYNLLKNSIIKEIEYKFDVNHSFLVLSNISKIFESVQKLNDTFKIITDVSKHAFGLIRKIGQFSVVFNAIEAGFLLLEGIFGKENRHGYVFKTQDGTEFIWDGGSNHEHLWGLIKYDTRTIEDMKLLEPIAINEPQQKKYYYWNKKEYADLGELKTDQIYWMLNQNDITSYTNPYFKFKYTFDNINNVDNNNPSNNNIVSFDSQENLLEYVKNDINSQNSKYLYKNLFAFSSGEIVKNKQQAKKNIIDNIIENIRSTKVIQLPKLENGMPVLKNAISPFIYPQKSWYKNEIIKNETNNHYLIDNSANTLKPDKNISDQIEQNDYLTPSISEAEEKAFLNIKKRFYESFAVYSKIVPISQFSNEKKYDDMKSSLIGNQVLYEVKLPNGLKNYFFYAKDATKWLMKQLKFNKYSHYETTTSFIYNQQSFKNEDQLIEWVN